jgi:hypothetical protein
MILAASVPMLWACADATGPNGAGNVAVRFEAVIPTAASAAPGSLASTASAVQAAAGDITLTGGDNILVISDLRLIVSEIEMENEGGECAGGLDIECEEFEAGPFLVDLLDGSDVVTASVPEGSYTEVEFEIEDLDADDDDDGAKQGTMESLLAQIRADYPDFPSHASMVVRGTYNDQAYTVYFAAEIEVEKEFSTPFQVPEDGSILVHLDPSAWFMVGGEPMDLFALDGQTVDFEAEFDVESGIEVEHDD